jgi:hypothetical protein
MDSIPHFNGQLESRDAHHTQEGLTALSPREREGLSITSPLDRNQLFQAINSLSDVSEKHPILCIHRSKIVPMTAPRPGVLRRPRVPRLEHLAKVRGGRDSPGRDPYFGTRRRTRARTDLVTQRNSIAQSSSPEDQSVQYAMFAKIACPDI